ncbi:MAG: 50S ribosomal protein L21 [Bacteroidales bacterium]|nr:50S ribosomal protein L21 [Bacteroidales bacterium]MCF8386999.1 50S ribosomal protein L21 [Bacteroidales bacterium]MCF8397828.1 50S ribosomal protein L21 [Bacteroidales bacterium]
MYAIVDIAGQQFKVEKGQEIFVHQLDKKEGEKVDFYDVLLIDKDGNIMVGQPTIEGAKISAKVLENLKGDKVMVFKKKRRKGYQKMNGHRQLFSKIQIEEITEKGAKKPEKTEAKKEEKKETKKAAPKKAAAKKTSATKTTAKKTETKKAEPKKAEAKTTESKKTEKKEVKSTKTADTAKKEEEKKEEPAKKEAKTEKAEPKAETKKETKSAKKDDKSADEKSSK